MICHGEHSKWSPLTPLGTVLQLASFTGGSYQVSGECPQLCLRSLNFVSKLPLADIIGGIIPVSMLLLSPPVLLWFHQQHPRGALSSIYTHQNFVRYEFPTEPTVLCRGAPSHGRRKHASAWIHRTLIWIAHRVVLRLGPQNISTIPTSGLQRTWMGDSVLHRPNQ